MFWKKIPVKKIIRLGKTAALFSKPIVTPAMYIVSVTALVVVNIGLVNTTANEPRFIWFFNGVFALIVIGTYFGDYIREKIAHRLNKDLDNLLISKLTEIYVVAKMTQSDARAKATEDVENFTFETILEYIQKYEKTGAY